MGRAAACGRGTFRSERDALRGVWILLAFWLLGAGVLLWLGAGLLRAALARRAVSQRERAARLLFAVLTDPTLEYSRLRREWPDVRGDGLLREGARLLERLRHPVLDRLDQSWLELETPKINDLIERLRAADEDGEPEADE